MRSGLYYFMDKSTHDIFPAGDLISWAEWMERNDNRRVALTKIGRRTVSTVFLGINHQFGEGPPIVFETMIFRRLPNTMDGSWGHQVFCRRYSTWEEAIAGHKETVESVESGRLPVEEEFEE